MCVTSKKRWSQCFNARTELIFENTVALQIFRILDNISPPNLQKMFSFAVVSLITLVEIYIDCSSLVLDKQSLVFRGIAIWNSLPKHCIVLKV